MPIVIDPAKQFVSIDLYYVEEVKAHGNSVFHFVQSQSEFDDWRGRGYKTEEEVNLRPPMETEGPNMPGMPVKKEVDQDKIIYKISTTWKRLTWKDQNTIFSRCLKSVPGPEGKSQTEIDTILFRDLKLKLCLNKWDLKDDKGQEVPVTNDTIDMLVPEVAQELLNNFEKVTETGAED